jgi:hypothetical protein
LHRQSSDPIKIRRHNLPRNISSPPRLVLSLAAPSR